MKEKRQKGISDKQRDLEDLGLSHFYSVGYCFSFSSLALFMGIGFSCVSRVYGDSAAFLSLLIVGLSLIAGAIALLGFGLFFTKKKESKAENPILRCPSVSKTVLRNGYLVGGVLLLLGWASFTVGLLFFPQKPVNGAMLAVVSFVVLFYGRLLILSTIRDQLINKVSNER